MHRIAAVLLTIVWTNSDAVAQLQEPDSSRIRVSLLTVLPGSDIYSLWGHSAVRITDTEAGIDVSYNYGTFDFDDDWFVLKFMYGNLRYMLSRHGFERAILHYREVERRPVIEQELRLSEAQSLRLLDFLETNYLPENRFYSYDFLYDNCSTRIRDAFERALGDDVRFGDRPDPGESFRRLLDPYQREWPFLDAGIDWLLGAPVDRIARPYETMFLPDYLLEAFEHATIEVEGEHRPLVVSTDTLVWIDEYDEPGGEFPWSTLAAWFLFAAGGLLTLSEVRRGRRYRSFDAALFIVVGIAGLLITFLWFVSLHQATNYNWHLLWTWPTHLVAGVALFRKRMPLWLSRYLLVAGVMALVAVLGSPLWPQEFHTALYPIMLLVALRSGAPLLRSSSSV